MLDVCNATSSFADRNRIIDLGSCKECFLRSVVGCYIFSSKWHLWFESNQQVKNNFKMLGNNLIILYRITVTDGLLFAIITIFFCIIGVQIDGIAYSVFSSEVGCMNNQSHQYWGKSNAQSAVRACMSNENAQSFKDILVNSNYKSPSSIFNFMVDRSYQCVCTDTTVCSGYDLTTGDCGDILSVLPFRLFASTVTLVLLMFFSIVYVIAACVLCYEYSSVKNAQKASEASILV